MRCAVCEARTLGFIVSRSGGTRVLVVALPQSRKVYCKPCGRAQVEHLDSR